MGKMVIGIVLIVITVIGIVSEAITGNVAGAGWLIADSVIIIGGIILIVVGYKRYKSYDKDGYDKDGYDIYGYDRYGCDRGGYNGCGYKDGYDRDGYDICGYDRNGYDRDGKDRDGKDRFFVEILKRNSYIGSFDALDYYDDTSDWYDEP